MSLKKCPNCNRWVGDGTHLGPGGYATEYEDCQESKEQIRILRELIAVWTPHAKVIDVSPQ